jgi:hypothetical protein
MKRTILFALIALVAWKGYERFQSSHRQEAFVGDAIAEEDAPPTTAPNSASHFQCDGRTHCSQMSSCEEATYFLKNCPGTKMDGNHDGVPCEKQWCK